MGRMRALLALLFSLAAVLVTPVSTAPSPQPAVSREQLLLVEASFRTKSPERAGPKDVIKSLKAAEIIPTVLDDNLRVFFLIEAVWNSTFAASLGNTLDPEKLQDAPSVALLPAWGFHIPSGDDGDDDDDNDKATRGEQLPSEKADDAPKPPTLPQNNLVIALTDPDAPSRDDPKWSEMCHWIAIGASIKLVPPFLASTSINDEEHPDCASASVATYALKDVMPYKPPGPPPSTGKHRYVFVAYAPKNGTAEPLDLISPGDRQHWGRGKDGGVREWADDMGLVPLGANFVYAQSAEQ